MRALLIAALLVAIGLAGCSDSPAADNEGSDEFGGQEIEADETTGGIRGVVVDEAIRPVPEAIVTLSPGDDEEEILTDEQGRFVFSGLEPGGYVIEVTKQLYDKVQTPATVEAGVTAPDIVRVQLTRVITEQPFIEGFQKKGQIVCSYTASLVLTGITAPCITDYTTIACNGGCLGPENGDTIRGLQGDTRDFFYTISPDWKSHIIEAHWEPSAQGTSDQLGVTVSYVNRTAFDYFASYDSTSPMHLHLKEGEVGPNQQGEPELIAAEGRDDMKTFFNVGGSDAQVALQQSFEVFFTTSYHLPLPDDWSVINGDEDPF